MANITDVSLDIVPLLVELIHKQQLSADLGNFLLDTHPAKQILDPFIDRKVLILLFVVASQGDGTCTEIENVFAGTDFGICVSPRNSNLGF